MFGIPCPASAEFTYVNLGAAADDNVATITYKNDAGTTIGVLTLTYVGTTNNILTITRTT
ncbi:hypothetical protein UFOVP1319_49 [uncultured Caudovirales phage]|uniref:Uncharacterized protein n=1 Tax=uncultured Caudovirales phage TaxID=2100421 RepID=A0A6J5RKP2_9CAUD|nr:hypothetical protein UFOVP478_32 [uncultured Caudovirales phage]CAB4191025.1 hypothetical protein UFOVP1225_7 [uncultured Caudovirales phage]CAB4198060.1 hypothetical protein UFOVP1319_49 [uncultured Caudovirales phage]CAB4217075.1 hypothetical protein UFOVP1591_7 [uncultured Caudovirales phage]